MVKTFPPKFTSFVAKFPKKIMLFNCEISKKNHSVLLQNWNKNGQFCLHLLPANFLENSEEFPKTISKRHKLSKNANKTFF